MKELRNTLYLLLGIGFLFLIYQYMRPKTDDAFPLQRPMDVVELSDGKIAIADGGGYLWNDSGSKVIVIDRNKKMTWSYRGSLRYVHGLDVLKNGNFLISDTGGDRLLQVDRNKNHVWISDRWGKSWGKLQDGSHLDFPVSAQWLERGRYLISDSGNGRIIEADREGKVFWSYSGFIRQAGARVIANGNILISDPSSNRILEIGRNGKIAWQMNKGLNRPQNADALSNGNILIADTDNDRILEVTKEGKTVREIKGMLNRPNRAIVLKNGNVLVCDTGHARLLEMDVSNSVVWEFRNINPIVLRERLTNGGAELVSGKKAAGWNVCDLLAHNDGFWSVDNRNASEGSNSLSIKCRKMPDGKMFWGQLVKAVPGKNMKLSASVKTLLTEGVAGIGLFFLDEWYGKIGETNLLVNQLVNDWTTVQLSVRIPQKTAELFVILTMEGVGQCWFDDVQLTGKIR